MIAVVILLRVNCFSENSLSGGNKLSKVRSFIILRSGKETMGSGECSQLLVVTT